MKTYIHALFPAVLIAVLMPALAAAQATSPKMNPCVADPQGSAGDKTLTEQLDDCNGVLQPPKIGDGEIVEPAPKGGEIIVIPPTDVPEQQSQMGASNPKSDGQGYDIAEIIDAIAHSEEAAREQLDECEPTNFPEKLD